jgi:hypothetical protein
VKKRDKECIAIRVHCVFHLSNSSFAYLLQSYNHRPQLCVALKEFHAVPRLALRVTSLRSWVCAYRRFFRLHSISPPLSENSAPYGPEHTPTARFSVRERLWDPYETQGGYTPALLVWKGSRLRPNGTIQAWRYYGPQDP